MAIHQHEELGEVVGESGRLQKKTKTDFNQMVPGLYRIISY